ncbi:hypothetical protein LPJ61_002054 [Coemansia biformis]|uniref:Succinate dehydrogenase assembly factor 3 n=1 Tax=Coemansia biformis TaxID=1286918 RepID=A0A9W7Y900_9FUNG|nr:hypothetical protein LPJ61_002054 [Coemansia biformis]
MADALQLYRSILRTHRLLPRELRFVGDQYVRSEFRSHRAVTEKRFLDQFFAQWASYLALLREQTKAHQSPLAGGAGPWQLGRRLDPGVVDRLDDAKAEQLLELHRASHEAASQPGGDVPGSSAPLPPRRK